MVIIIILVYVSIFTNYQQPHLKVLPSYIAPRVEHLYLAYPNYWT